MIATGRKLPELAALKTEAGTAHLDTIALDVTSTSSIAAAVTAVDSLTKGRGLDVLVNNAGFGILGPTSEIGDSEMRRQYETNVFGLMNVTRAFLPKMIERRAGRVINVSSVGGRITLPYFGVYNSTKYADRVALRCAALRAPPARRRRRDDRARHHPHELRGDGRLGLVAVLDYAVRGRREKYEQMSKFANKFASNPIVIAKAISRAVNARRPRARYVAPFSNHMIFAMATFLPTRVWDWAMRKVGFLNKKSLQLSATRNAPPAQIRAAQN